MKSDRITRIIDYIFNILLLLLISPNFSLLHQYSFKLLDTAVAKMTGTLSPLLFEVFFSNRTCFNTPPKRAMVRSLGAFQ